MVVLSRDQYLQEEYRSSCRALRRLEPEDYDALIDLALAMKDKRWFKLLIKKKFNLEAKKRLLEEKG
jgi:hypothetical protein